MATVSASILASPSAFAQRAVWTPLTTVNDVGAAVELHHFTDRSVQVVGTFGAGGSVSIEGSNDGGTTWKVLTDPQGNALTFTAAGLEAISEMTQKLRPHVTAGDGTTSLSIYVFSAGGGT
jgi:hypothetical protein